MDRRLLEHYNRELGHLREVGAEFASEFPKIASRLGIKGSEVVLDPYVERLLEGTAFLSARVQVKLDAEFPRFTQHLLEMLYPHYLAPTPAMLVAQFQPILGDANLAVGSVLPRGTVIRNGSDRPGNTACEFRTASDLALWPLELVEARYFSFAPDLPLGELALPARCKGGVRLRLRATAGLQCSQLKLDKLRFFLGGASDVAHKLHELIGTSTIGVLHGRGAGTAREWKSLAAESVRLAGFDDEEALLPVSARNFGGYRLLQEYFSFPSRYLFFEIDGLAPLVSANDSPEMELVVLFGRGEAELESTVGNASFLLHCVPAVNLFDKRIDRIQVQQSGWEFHVVPDRTRPTDFEIYDLTEVVGYGGGAQREQQFRPFYSTRHAVERQPEGYFTLRREPRLVSESQRRGRRLTGYVGSEVFLSLVDPNEAPYSENLRQLSLRARCTNRDLPMLMQLGGGRSDFALEVAAPIESIHCVKGPSRPYSALAQDAQAWKFISQLSLNYLSLLDSDREEGAAALRELLGLYASTADPGMRRHVEGLRSVHCEPVVARLPMPGPLCFGRGVEITLEMDELAFEGGSAFMLGSVLERFFARHVTINGFTETVLRTLTRGELMHWGARCGTRPIL